MSGWLNAISNGLHSVANHVREASLTPHERSARDNGRRTLEFIKVAAVIATFAELFFLCVCPGLFNLFLFATTAFGAFQVHRVADNVIEMLDNAVVELTARSSRNNFIKQVTKNTYVVESIINIINPDLSPILIGQA